MNLLKELVEKGIKDCDKALETAPFPGELHSYQTGKRVAYNTVLKFIETKIDVCTCAKEVQCFCYLGGELKCLNCMKPAGLPKCIKQ